MAWDVGPPLSAPGLTWQVAKHSEVIPDPSEVSQNCLLLTLALSTVVQLIEFACSVICGQGRKTEGGPERDDLSYVLQHLQMALRDGHGDEEDIGLREAWS